MTRLISVDLGYRDTYKDDQRGISKQTAVTNSNKEIVNSLQ